MASPLRALAGALLFLTVDALAVTTDFSAELDQIWDYAKPAVSEQRFRDEAAKYPPDSREALETQTQLARTQGLQRKFADADRILDAVEPKLAAVPARVKVRYLLERGRTRNSSGDRKAAMALFADALAVSQKDTLPGADFYRVDTLHMLAIAAPKEAQLDWNLKALAASESSSDPRARGWAGSLNNNIGWTYFNQGDVNEAVAHWEKVLPLREASGNALNIRIAKWTIARGYRAQGRLPEALAIQSALAVETEKINEPDGYVYEELAEITYAKGDAAAAKAWAAKAYPLLKDDPDMRGETARLARMDALAQGRTP
ncbi:MAG: tetratricopeptide repeat protein [Burkholderiales bacterium]